MNKQNDEKEQSGTVETRGSESAVERLVGHCRPHYLTWEQRATCLKCAHPLADNGLVKDAYKMNTVNAWAKGQLNILADMAEHRGMQWFADETRAIAGKLLHL